MGNTFQFAWEVKLIEWCQSFLPSFVIDALDTISYVGDTLFIVAILGFLYLCYDKKIGKKLAFNALFSLMFACEIKNVFKRRRPYFDNKNIKCLKIVDKNYDQYDIKGQGFSFPSMHSSNSMTVFGTLYRYYQSKPFLLCAIILPLIVGISRFVLGCHYPTDVLAGWLIGLLVSIFVSKFQDKLSDKYLYIFLIVVGAIGFIFCESNDFYSTYGLTIGIIISGILDEKYIHFSNTKNIKRMICRLIIACGTYLLVSQALKLPFSADVLEADTLFAYAYRTFRYALASLLGIGLTPILYKYNLLKVNE